MFSAGVSTLKLSESWLLGRTPTAMPRSCASASWSSRWSRIQTYRRPTRPKGTTYPRWIHFRSVAGLTPIARAAAAVLSTLRLAMASPRRSSSSGRHAARPEHRARRFCEYYAEGLLPTVWQHSLSTRAQTPTFAS